MSGRDGRSDRGRRGGPGPDPGPLLRADAGIHIFLTATAGERYLLPDLAAHISGPGKGLPAGSRHRTGTAFDGHYIRFHTDCSVIANNFLVTPQHEQKYMEASRLLSMRRPRCLQPPPT